MTSTVTRYKLMRVRRNGTLGPLFINRKQVIPVGQWLDAENHPTKGYAIRPGWHMTDQPEAPHLSMAGRVWCEVEAQECSYWNRPAKQGGRWTIAQRMRVLHIVPQYPCDK